jgi:Meiotically Up-regulated Gene 113 (MUG113) protein
MGWGGEEREEIMGVYFITTMPDMEYVKIGVAEFVNNRLAGLQTASPFELRIVGYDKFGDRNDEGRLHARFGHLRIKGEWFRFTEEIRDYIRDSQIEVTGEIIERREVAAPQVDRKPRPAWRPKPISPEELNKFEEEIKSITGIPPEEPFRHPYLTAEEWATATFSMTAKQAREFHEQKAIEAIVARRLTLKQYEGLINLAESKKGRQSRQISPVNPALPGVE